MLWGGSQGGLELRRENSGTVRLAGRFPYGKRAVLSDGGRTGRPRKEVIAPKAFAYRVETPSKHGGPKEIHLLVGHDFNRPLASVRNGTLVLTDTPEALIFEAEIAAELQKASYVADFLANFTTGLMTGISPGFRLPPARVVKEPETIEEEPDDGELDENGEPQRGAIIRTVHEALLYELSVVTRPAYPEAQIEARNWEVEVGKPALITHLNRWRV